MKEVSTSFLKEGNYKGFINKLNNSNTDYIHFDVMDGIFVKSKNLSIKELIKYINQSTKKNDVHLMVKNPEKYIEQIKTLNINNITIHREIPDYKDVINLIKSYGIKPGLAINPETEINDIKKDLKDISLVLVMGVHPGKSGQQYLINTTDKINKLKEIKIIVDNEKRRVGISVYDYLKNPTSNLKEKENLNFKISVDGGINEEILPKLNNTDIIVSASYVLDNLDNIEKIHNL